MSEPPCPPLTGIPRPPKYLMFMRETPRTIVHNGFRMVSQLRQWGVLAPDGMVLDVGCGYGRLAYGLLAHGHAGRYVGIDILPQQIAWLQRHLAPHLPKGSRFVHMDVRNDRYNPNGKLHPNDVSFSGDLHPDLVTLYSVFTHMYDRDIEKYLSELHKISGSNTYVCMSCFLITPETRALEKAGKSTLPMTHRQSEHCWYFSKQDPLLAIAYDESWMTAMLARTGFVVHTALLGNWCGRTGQPTGQDTLILRPL